ncbi:MAG: hypothetical protein HYW62_01565 [Candidatus Levybacteria bacterium]|nr:hypothetical protein [Candidatus Levybacteria bacterium]
MAWPKERLAEEKLKQGRDILDFSRRGADNFVGIIEAYLTIKNQKSTKEERIKAGENWRNGIMLHVIASIDPISKGKKKKHIPVYVENIEIAARQAIHDITIEKGGTEEQAQYLEERLTRMTKFFQIKSGVRDNTGLPVRCK